MLLRILENNKGVLILFVMFILFTFIASARVERLENNIKPKHNQMVYNR